jgi:plasmid stabilization system protein ParE
MSSKFEVKWTNIAEQDLIKIIEYISNNNPKNALIVLKKIKGEASKLYEFPNRSRIIPELQAQGLMLYREIIVPPWRIFYRIASKKVFVLGVIDSRQNVEDILLNRLINVEE